MTTIFRIRRIRRSVKQPDKSEFDLKIIYIGLIES